MVRYLCYMWWFVLHESCWATKYFVTNQIVVMEMPHHTFVIATSYGAKNLWRFLSYMAYVQLSSHMIFATFFVSIMTKNKCHNFSDVRTIVIRFMMKKHVFCRRRLFITWYRWRTDFCHANVTYYEKWWKYHFQWHKWNIAEAHICCSVESRLGRSVYVRARVGFLLQVVCKGVARWLRGWLSRGGVERAVCVAKILRGRPPWPSMGAQSWASTFRGSDATPSWRELPGLQETPVLLIVLRRFHFCGDVGQDIGAVAPRRLPPEIPVCSGYCSSSTSRSCREQER